MHRWICTFQSSCCLKGSERLGVLYSLVVFSWMDSMACMKSLLHVVWGAPIFWGALIHDPCFGYDALSVDRIFVYMYKLSQLT